MTTDMQSKRLTGPVRPVGVRFYLDEWASVEDLMAKTKLNITDLIKTAVAEKAKRNGIPFPKDTATEAAS